MTSPSNPEPISWLEYRAQVTGKSVEEIKAEMSARSKLADKSKTGFASMTPERLQEVTKKGRDKRKKNVKET